MYFYSILRFTSLMLLVLAFRAGAVPENKVNHFKLDPGHTQVVFKISHLGFSYVLGQFTDVKGEFSLNDVKPAENKLKIEIATGSINTHSPDRDEHLRKPDFFDAKKFPKITFVSSVITKESTDVYMVKGNLEMHGKTKPVSFQFTRLKTGSDMQGKTRTGGFATFTVKRSDFGMNYMLGTDKIGDDVEITVNVEAVLQ